MQENEIVPMKTSAKIIETIFGLVFGFFTFLGSIVCIASPFYFIYPDLLVLGVGIIILIFGGITFLLAKKKKKWLALGFLFGGVAYIVIPFLIQLV